MAKLPSLNILKAFESAARHLSFKLAADELCLTPSAISHQVRTLEKQLGVQLFNRLSRGIELTTIGEQYCRDVSAAIRMLEKATEQLTQRSDANKITISCIPFVTNHFLVPHLPKFKQQNPNYSLKLLSQVELADLHAGDVDMAVRYQKQNRDDLAYIPLTDVKLTPVCTAEYWANYCQQGSKFSDHRFISLSVDNKTWTTWLSQFYPKQPMPEFEIELDNYQAVKQAALQGLGLAMGYWPAVEQDIKSGELIAPYQDQVSDFGAMYLVYPVEDHDKASVTMIRQWMESIFSHSS